MEMVALWQELDLSTKEEWARPVNRLLYQKKFECERVYEFLARFNTNLDDVKGKILGYGLLSLMLEVFSKFYCEENQMSILLNKGKIGFF